MRSLSVAVITFNEENNIRKLLNALQEIASEIIVVDSFSTDSTASVCAGYPKVKFFEKKFDGYGEQKNFALEHCSGDWILFLDADEIPDKTLLDSVKTILSKENPEFSVYEARFNNFIGKYHLRYGGWGKLSRPRFFQKNSAKYSDDKVHEFLITTGKHGLLEGRINHYTYRDIFHHIEKSNKYTSMMAEKMLEQNRRSSVGKIVFKPVFQFIKSYFIRRGFMDGLAGFYAAVTAAFYTFLKYMKLYELFDNK